MLLVAVVLVGLYLMGVRRLDRGRPGRRWPAGRTAAFVSGVAVLLFATCSGLARYDDVLFSLHTAQHVLLGMVAPLLLVLGDPITLALQAAHRPVQVVLVRWLRHPLVALGTHPVFAWVLFGGTLFGLYFSPLFERSLVDPTVHQAVHLHFLAAGTLFCLVAVGHDAGPRRLGSPARLLFVLIAVPFHAFLGLAVLNARDHPLGGGVYEAVNRAWGSTVAADQAVAAGILWGVGDLFGLVVGGIVLARWIAEDARHQAQEDRLLDRARATA
ncbi:MAG: hypothetical protein JWO77_497 [Ilumatobacteraceae bacterium]|nr:hypothetical protein [Ilumatobacteraceae bacterium]